MPDETDYGVDPETLLHFIDMVAPRMESPEPLPIVVGIPGQEQKMDFSEFYKTDSFRIT